MSIKSAERNYPSPAPRERVPEGKARRRVRVAPPVMPSPTRRCRAGSPLSRGAGEGFVGALLVLILLLMPLAAEAALVETPMFAAQVASGALPPINQRMPREPGLAELETIGRPGGELRMLMASPKDTRLMVVYGYSRLVAYTPALALVPDMLEALDVVEDRIFTLRLRTGHKWSDGQPFTTEDFRYWFEDVAENPDLSSSGLPLALLPNGEKPKFEIVDAQTVRFSWSRPNPLFLPALDRPDPVSIHSAAQLPN